MRGPAVTQSVWRYMLADMRVGGRLFTCVPNGLVGYGPILPTLSDAAREQIDPRLLPAPLLPQGLQQGGAERKIATGSALAALYTDHHAPAVDIAHLEHRYLRPPHPRAVECHQQGTLLEVAGSIDEPCDLFQTQHRRQSAMG